VTINIPGNTPFEAPKTGASGTSAMVFGGLLSSGLVLWRKRREIMSLILA
jgi:LPXTG-motif cell wall-anchored protein